MMNIYYIHMMDGSFEKPKPTRKESARMKGGDLFQDAYREEGAMYGIRGDVSDPIGLKKPPTAKKEARGTKPKPQAEEVTLDLSDDAVEFLEEPAAAHKREDFSDLVIPEPAPLLDFEDLPTNPDNALPQRMAKAASDLDYDDLPETDPNYKPPEKLANTLKAPRRSVGSPETKTSSKQAAAEDFKNYASKPRGISNEYSAQAPRRSPKLEAAPPDTLPDQPLPFQHLEGRISALETQLTHLGTGQENLKKELTQSLSAEIRKLSEAVQAQRPAKPRVMPNTFVAPPPTVGSWFSTKIKNAAEAVGGFWNKLTGKKAYEVATLENPVSREFQSNLIEATSLARDLPTMLLTGKTMEGAKLTDKEKEKQLDRFEMMRARITDADLAPKRVDGIIRDRLNYINFERAAPIEKLVAAQELPANTSYRAQYALDRAEKAADVLAKNLPKDFKAFEAINKTTQDTTLLAKNKTTLVEAQRLLGVKEPEQMCKRAILISEAVARLPGLNLDDASKRGLMQDYTRQLTVIDKIVRANSPSKAALYRLMGGFEVKSSRSSDSDLTPFDMAA